MSDLYENLLKATSNVDDITTEKYGVITKKNGNYCSVKESDNGLEHSNVPIVNGANLNVGDKVIIGFLNNSIYDVVVYGALDKQVHDDTKQDKLISGENIKTINNESLLGSGNLVIEGGGTGVDIVTEWETTTSDSKVASEKLTKDSLDTKVDKETGKGLSSNDFTNTYKSTMDSLKSVATTGSYNDLSNKPSIPSSSSDLSDGSSLVKTSSTTGLLKNDGSVMTSGTGSSNWAVGNHTHSAYVNPTKVISWSSTPSDDNVASEKLIKDSLDGKQATLVSGTSIKTINNESVLGSGNISISGSGTVDTALSTTSTNPVQNKVITTSLTEYVVGTSGTSASATWTGTCSRLTEVKDGTVIFYYITNSTSGISNVTLNLTLANNTTTGAKNVYFKGTTRLSTQFPTNTIIGLAYTTKKDNGSWYVITPNDNNSWNAHEYGGVQIASGESIATTTLCGAKSDGKYYKLANGVILDTSYPIIYSNTAYTTSTTSSNNLYNKRYDAVITATKSMTLTAPKPVYIEGSAYSNGKFTISSNVITQTLTTGNYYWLIGFAYDSTHLRFDGTDKTIYYYDGNNLKNASSESTWEAITLTNGTLYVNQSCRLCELQYSHSALSLTSNTWASVESVSQIANYPPVNDNNYIQCSSPPVIARVKSNGDILANTSNGGSYAIAFTTMWHYDDTPTPTYLFYDDCTTDKSSEYGSNHYLKNASASVSFTYDNNGYYTVNTNNIDGFSDIPIPSLDNKNNYYIEAEFYTTDTTTGGQSGIVLYPSTDTGGNGVMFRDIANINRCGVLKFTNGSENGESGNSSQSSLPVANNWYKLRVEVNGTSITGKWLKIDGTQVYSHTYTVPYTSGAMRVGLAFLPKSSTKPYRVRNIIANSL